MSKYHLQHVVHKFKLQHCYYVKLICKPQLQVYDLVLRTIGIQIILQKIMISA
jgi:hypothetical protein